MTDNCHFFCLWDRDSGHLRIVTDRALAVGSTRVVLIERSDDRTPDRPIDDTSEEDVLDLEHIPAPPASPDPTSVVHETSSYIVPWIEIVASTMVLNVGRAHRVVVQVFELDTADEPQGEVQIINLGRLELMDDADPTAGEHDAEPSEPTATLCDQVAALTLLTSDGTPTVFAHKVLTAPASRDAIARHIRLGLAGLAGGGLPDRVHVVAGCIGNVWGPLEEFDLDAEEVVRLEGRVAEVEGQTAFVPSLKVKIPNYTDKCLYLANAARLIHWRRNEHYVLSRLSRSQGAKTGDIVVDILQHVVRPLPPPVGTAAEDLVPQTGLWVYDLPAEPGRRIDNDLLYEFRFPSARHGDVVGIIFADPVPPRSVRKPNGTADIVDVDIGPDDLSLWVVRDDQLILADDEPQLLPNDLKDEIVRLCNHSKPVVATAAQGDFRSRIAASQPRSSPLANGAANSVPTISIDVYSKCLATSLRAASPMSSLTRMDRGQLSASASFVANPGITALLHARGFEAMRDLATERWEASLASPADSLERCLALSSVPADARAWLTTLSAPEQQLCVWFLLSNRLEPILESLATANVSPDETLVAECLSRNRSVAEKLRALSRLTRDRPRLQQLQAQAQSEGRKRSFTIISRLISSPDTILTYSEALRVLAADQ